MGASTEVPCPRSDYPSEMPRRFGDRSGCCAGATGRRRRAPGVSAGTVSETVRRAKAAGLTSWLAVEGLAPSEFEARLYPAAAAAAERPAPDCAWIHRERRRPGVTLEVLHLEYLEREPNGLGYTQFCQRYRPVARAARDEMRQLHRAGEKTFVDDSGKKPCIFQVTASNHSIAGFFNGVYVSFDWPLRMNTSSDLMSWKRVFEPLASGLTQVVVGSAP